MMQALSCLKQGFLQAILATGIEELSYDFGPKA